MAGLALVDDFAGFYFVEGEFFWGDYVGSGGDVWCWQCRDETGDCEEGEELHFVRDWWCKFLSLLSSCRLLIDDVLVASDTRHREKLLSLYRDFLPRHI